LEDAIIRSDTETSYKILYLLKDLLEISNVLKHPNFITRFNSISSAVGPLVIDNLITEKKLKDFSGTGNPIPLINSRGE